MNQKYKKGIIAIFQLPSHAVRSGYIYIPTKFRNKLPKEPFPVNIKFLKQSLELIVKIDSSGRLRAIQSKEKPVDLKMFFQECNIKPKYEVKIYYQETHNGIYDWEIIIKPPDNLIQIQTVPREIIEGPTNQFLEIANFMQQIGPSNIQKGSELANDIFTLVEKTFNEVLDPTYFIKDLVEDCVSESQQDLRLHAFFKIYWESETVRRLFSNRAEDLLPLMQEESENNEDENINQSPSYLLYLPITSPLTDDDISSVNSINSRILLELSHRYQSLTQLVKKLINKIGDIIIEREDADEELANINIQLMFAELLELIQKEIKKDEIRNDIQLCVKDAISDWGWLIPRILWFLVDNQIKTNLKWMTNLSRRCHLNPQTIYDALSQLIEEEMLRPIATINWCNNHTKKPQYYISMGIGTSVVCFCGICKGEMKQMRLTPLHPSILKFLKHHDGLPLIATSWLAKQEGLQWGSNYSFDNGEMDLWIADRKSKKAAIFEFWMTNVSEDTRAFGRRLQTKMRQTEIIAEKLNHSINGIPITKKFVVVNIPSLILNNLSKKQRERNDVSTISIDEVSSIIKSFN